MGNFLGSGYATFIPTFTLDGTTKIFQTVHMVKPDLTPSATLINTDMRGAWCGASRPYNAAQMYVGYTLARTEVYVNYGGVVTYDLNETPIVGTKVNSFGTPINTSILGKKVTGIVGKRYRGRHMWPNMWIAESGISQAGIIGSGDLSPFQTLVTSAMGNQITNGLPAVLGHSSSEVVPTPYTTTTVQPKIGTMRKRIRGY